MGVVVIETDFGTKRATLLRLEEMRDKKKAMLEQKMYKYWQKVYMTAIEECPKDTGALAASIRLRKKGETTQPSSGPYGISMASGDVEIEWYITAGGAGSINPKHNREVDYAQAVHEGYRDAGGKWHPPNRFLERAFQKCNKELFRFMDEVGRWYEEEWKKGALVAPPSDFFIRIPVGMAGSTGIYKMTSRQLERFKGTVKYV
jgi:hypothetical protein